jgi:hypothetical protein
MNHIIDKDSRPHEDNRPRLGVVSVDRSLRPPLAVGRRGRNVQTILLVRGATDDGMEQELASFLDRYRIKSVTSVYAAFDFLKRAIIVPSILIFDVPLSVAETRELARQLAALGAPPASVPVVMLSEAIPEVEHDNIADEWCICCLGKPVNVERLELLLDTLVDAVSAIKNAPAEDVALGHPDGGSRLLKMCSSAQRTRSGRWIRSLTKPCRGPRPAPGAGS